MKKSLLAVAVTGAAIVLVSPKIISNQADAELQKSLDAINDVPGYNLTVTSEQKGWFSSQRVLNFALDFTEMDPSLDQNNPEVAALLKNFSFDMNLDMQYGPILLNKGVGLSDIQLVIPNTSEEVKHNGEKVKDLYHFDGKLSLLNDLSYSDAISPMQMSMAELGMDIDFTGYEGKATSKNSTLDYTADAGTFSITSPFFNVKVANMEVTYNGDSGFAELLQGIYGNMTNTFSIGSIEASQAGESLFSMEKFELFSNSVLDESGLLDMDGGYRIATINTPIDTFEEVEIAVELNNLDQYFIKAVNKINSHSVDPNLTPDEFLQIIEEDVLKVLAKQPELKISNVGFKTQAGVFKSEAVMTLAKYDMSPDEFKDASFWQNNLVVDSAIALPKELALDLAQKGLYMQIQADPGSADYTPDQLQEIAMQQAQMTLDNFLAGGFLVEVNGLLQLNFNIKDGVGNLNGNQIPLAALLPAEQAQR